MRTIASLLTRIRPVAAAAIVVAALTVAGCDSTSPVEDAGESEVISDVTLTLTNTADASDVATATAVFNADGSRDDDASSLALSLASDATYDGTITFTNRFADDPSEQDVTAEVRAEAREHQVFYVMTGDVSSAATLTVTDVETDYRDDADAPSELRSDVPVGLRFTVTVNAGVTPGTSGRLRVALGHFDDGKTPGEELSADTELDVDTTFDVDVQ